MHTLRLAALVLFAGLFSVGCTAGTSGEDFDLAGMKSVDGGRCTPGDTQSCICLGGGNGTQTCRASGASFGPCSGCSGSELPDGIIVAPKDMNGSPCGDCDGCCDGAVCLPFNNETNMKCGQRGQACAACPGTKVCAPGTGQCVDNSGGCGGCTNGCCGASTGDVCLLNQPAACGTSCTKCTYGVTCNNGACTTQIDQNAYFKVLVKTTKITVNDTTCKDNWDYIGEPNVYVCVGYESGGTLYQGCNDDYNTASLNVTWNNTTNPPQGLMTSGGAPFLIPASIFTSGKMQMWVYDSDYPDPDDLIANGTFPGKATLDAQYSTGAFGCATDVTFQLQ